MATDLSHQAAASVESSHITSHHMATDLSHYMTAETVESSRGKDNKQHLDENRLTLTDNKRRSPFHLPTAERLGATGGEPTVHIKLGRREIVSGIGGHTQDAEHCGMYRRCGTLSNVSEDTRKIECIGDAEHCHTTSSHITSHGDRPLVSRRKLSCRIESSHITSHHITSHGDLSYHGGTMSTYGGRSLASQPLIITSGHIDSWAGATKYFAVFYEGTAQQTRRELSLLHATNESASGRILRICS